MDKVENKIDYVSELPASGKVLLASAITDNTTSSTNLGIYFASYFTAVRFSSRTMLYGVG
jgi:hypothetical protein